MQGKTGPVLRSPWRKIIPAALGVVFLAWSIFVPQIISIAAPYLTIEPVTWNVVGLDPGNVNAGPNTFPIGGRVCNTGDTSATNVLAIFHWENENQYIDLSSPSNQTYAVLPAGECIDFYYDVTITRDLNTIDTARRYHITATADTLDITSTPTPREIYVKAISSQPTLAVTGLAGPGALQVGGIYTYTLAADASNINYGQLVHSVNFPSAGFRVRQTDAAYTRPPNAVGDRMYADACGWGDDPNNASEYLTCAGPAPANFPGGVISGTMVVTYSVEVIAGGTYTLTTHLYGYTNGTYQYNADFGQDFLRVEAAVPTVDEDHFLPIILKQLASETSTSTPTPTGTLATHTPTVTGTPATQTPTTTVTGTTTPRPGATKGVSPNQARIGQNFTFTIRVVNNGSAPATNVELEDNFSAFNYLDIFDLSTTKGTRNITGRVVTVDIGTLNPGETVVVRIVVRVNSAALTRTAPCNTARITWSPSRSVTSNQECFTVLGGSSLPPTGELALDDVPKGPNLSSLLLIAFLGIAGMALLRFGISAWKSHPARARWLVGTGGAAALIALIAGLSMPGLLPNKETPVLEANLTQEPVILLSATPSATINPLARLPAYMFATPDPDEPLVIETLPSYPIPTPSIEATPAQGEAGPDTSAVVRMAIPKLDLDAKVAYVPFDGQSWKIQGLREEIAWLGDTSWPGLGGNTGFAGHITVRGLGNGPFRYLSDLGPGDEIQLYTQKNMYLYRVRELRVVEETDMWITEQTGGSQVTLITCVDWNETIGIYLKRLVVFADEVEVSPLAMNPDQAASW